MELQQQQIGLAEVLEIRQTHCREGVSAGEPVRGVREVLLDPVEAKVEGSEEEGLLRPEEAEEVWLGDPGALYDLFGRGSRVASVRTR